MRLLLAAVLTLAAGAAAAQAPALRPAVTVPGDLVLIGDLVERAGPAADIAVFRSPDLGETGTVALARVLEALRPHGVVAIDTRGLAEVAVTRASRVVAPAEFDAALAAALAAQHGLRAADLRVTLDRPLAPLHVEAQATAAPRVTRLAYDTRSGRFDASYEVPGSIAARQLALRSTGTALEIAEVVVVTRPVGRGEPLRAGDVAVERRPRAEIGGDAFVSTDSAAGMAARRALRAGQVLRADDLMKPDLVLRNEPVALVFTAPGIVLSTRGRAMTSGAEGDTVSVANLQSRRVVQGIVTGPGQVTVSAGALTGQLAQADPQATGAGRPIAARTETIRPAPPAASPADPRTGR